MNNNLLLYCDASKTPQAVTYGWIAFYSGQCIAQDTGRLDWMKSVSAEVAAVIKALEWTLTQRQVRPRKIIARTDCSSVPHFLTKLPPVQKTEVRELAIQLIHLVRLTDATVQWIPRQKNRSADRLSRSVWERE